MSSRAAVSVPTLEERALAVLSFLNDPRTKGYHDCEVDWAKRKVKPDAVAEHVCTRLQRGSRTWAQPYRPCGIAALIALLEEKGVVTRGDLVWTLKKPHETIMWHYKTPHFQVQCNSLLEAIRKKALESNVILTRPITFSLVDLLIEYGDNNWAEGLRFPQYDYVDDAKSVRSMLNALTARGLVRVEPKEKAHLVLTPRATGSY